MKILIVSHGIPSKDDPQWGCFELDQARALQSLGHSVIIMAVDGRYRRVRRKVGISHSVLDGINAFLIFWLPLKCLLSPVIMRCVRQRMALLLFRHIKKKYGEPDIVYSHYLFGMMEMQLVKRCCPHLPIVGIEHWSILNCSSLNKEQFVRGKIAYNTVDCLLSVSESLKLQIKKHFDKESEVVYDMLGGEFVGAQITKKKRGDEFKFVSVGSLFHIKAFDLLIDAFVESGLAYKGCSLTIIGDGEERENLQRQIQVKGVTGKVTLLGRKNKSEIISVLRESHAFVLASRAETFGVVYIEAMSQGLPVIATACGGPEEFVNESNGILIPTESVSALKDAMLRMYDNYERYDNVQIANECNRRFAPHNIAKQLETIFEEEIEKKRSPNNISK